MFVEFYIFNTLGARLSYTLILGMVIQVHMGITFFFLQEINIVILITERRTTTKSANDILKYYDST